MTSEKSHESTKLVQRKQQQQQQQQQQQPSALGQENEDTVLTVGEAIERIGFGVFHVWSAVLAGLLLMGEAMTLSMVGVIGSELQCLWRLSNMQMALFSFSTFAGFAVSGPAFGLLADKFGRRWLVLIGSLGCAYFAALSAFSPSFRWLVALRFLVGAGMASSPQGLVYMVECTPSSARAHLVNLSFIVWSVGVVAELLLALCLSAVREDLGWRLLVLLSASPILLSCFGLLAAPDSPRFCLLRRSEGDSRRQLRRIARINGCEAAVVADWRKLRLRPDLGDAVEKEEEEEEGLLGAKLRTTTLAMASATLLANFSYYGVMLYAQQLLQASSLGRSTTPSDLCQPAECREEARTETLQLLLLSGSAELPGCFLALVASRWLGRRRLLQIFSSASAACTLLLLLLVNESQSSSLLPLLLLLFLVRGSSVVIINCCNLFATELFPTRVRAIGIGVMQVAGKFGSVLTPVAAQIIFPVSAAAALMLYAAAAAAVMLIVTVFLVRETKGTDLRDR